MKLPLNSTTRYTFFGASLLGASAVMIGAFGAHALKDFLIQNNRFDTFETAVRYHFYGCFSLVSLGLLYQFLEQKLLKYAIFCQFLGSLIFCGALYTICFTGIKTFGIVAPIGGIFLVVSWFLVAWAFLKN